MRASRLVRSGAPRGRTVPMADHSSAGPSQRRMRPASLPSGPASTPSRSRISAASRPQPVGSSAKGWRLPELMSRLGPRPRASPFRGDPARPRHGGGRAGQCAHGPPRSTARPWLNGLESHHNIINGCMILQRPTLTLCLPSAGTMVAATELAPASEEEPQARQ